MDWQQCWEALDAGSLCGLSSRHELFATPSLGASAADRPQTLARGSDRDLPRGVADSRRGGLRPLLGIRPHSDGRRRWSSQAPVRGLVARVRHGGRNQASADRATRERHGLSTPCFAREDCRHCRSPIWGPTRVWNRGRVGRARAHHVWPRRQPLSRSAQGRARRDRAAMDW